jgi:hypothetical protein
MDPVVWWCFDRDRLGLRKLKLVWCRIRQLLRRRRLVGIRSLGEFEAAGVEAGSEFACSEPGRANSPEIMLSEIP